MSESKNTVVKPVHDMSEASDEDIIQLGKAPFTHKMWIVVRSDLPPGKVVNQACHATSVMVRRLEKNPTEEYKQWSLFAEPKIILSTDDEQVLKLLYEKYKPQTVRIRNVGNVQCRAGEWTCIAFPPMKTEDQPLELKSLKLYPTRKKEQKGHE